MYYDNDDMSFSGEASVLLMALAARVLVALRPMRELEARASYRIDFTLGIPL